MQRETSLPSKTPFAGLERLAPGESLSTDGYAFQDFDRATIDRILRVGAVTHHHDAHAALANPATAPTATVGTGGAIPSGLAISVAYTLLDADNGETLPSAATVVNTGSGYTNPFDAPDATVDYTAGGLLAGDYSYAVTVTDGAGGETAIGPAADVAIDPGHANAQVHLAGLTLATNDASSSDPAAGWRLWRVQGGGPWYLIGTGTAALDTFVDNGVPGDCTIAPPFSSTTRGASSLTVTIPSPGLPAVSSFNIYVSIDGSFTSPALLGNFPVTSFDIPQVIADLGTIRSGAPPAANTALPGAVQINPDTDIVNWYWKAPVDSVVDLPTVGNNDGDARITRDTDMIWVWSEAEFIWTQWNPGRATLASSTQPTDYTLALLDAGTVVEFTDATAATLTIAPNAVVGFPVGTVVEVFQYGAGVIGVAGATGVTVRSNGALVHTAGQYATISLRQREIDEWVLSGDLA